MITKSFLSTFCKINQRKHYFHGHPLRASAFTIPPFSIVDPKGENHGGYEYKIAKTVADSVGLHMEVKSPADGKMWGSSMPVNGKYEGTIRVGQMMFIFVISNSTYMFCYDKISSILLADLNNECMK